MGDDEVPRAGSRLCGCSQEGAATILHADLDAFYASVEQLLDPSLAGRPVAVGAGVVLAASYEARAVGVRAGMPASRARQLCPALRVVGGHFERYQELGDRVIDIMRDFTPLVERISIDEAFLDTKGAVNLFGPPAEIARLVRLRVRHEVGLPVSVGVARTKHLAKVASQVAKPDGLVVVQPGEEEDFLRPLPVELMWGVGPATRERLAGSGIATIGDLADAPGTHLEQLLGRAVGSRLSSLSHNVDPREIELKHRARSMGAQAALGRRSASPELLRSTFGYLCDRVAGRLRAAELAGRTVSVRVRFEDMRSVTRSVTLPFTLGATLTLTEVACELATEALSDHAHERTVSLLAVSVGNLVDEASLQLELPLGIGGEAQRPGAATGAARWGLDRSIDAVRRRYGRSAVGYASVQLSKEDRVPEGFRALAEHERAEQDG
jgi:DNA polymerase-4